ncbi:hypothetical protein MAR_023827 [Mya arenaria]|uniref:Uncharacterized protein n=1 Tax=Mya arenaria TaxID=6604 RepID=A0ABY7DS86_MYAAR|nr:hypothetical protein MAR_023827 [Mya arenaria]
MHISKDKGQWIFDEPLDQVIERTQSLINALDNVNYIVLVGGFSDLKYLQKRVRRLQNKELLFREVPCCFAIIQLLYKQEYQKQKRFLIGGRAYCDDIFEKHFTFGALLRTPNEECQQIGLLLVEIGKGDNRDFEMNVQLAFGGTAIQVEVRDGHGRFVVI